MKFRGQAFETMMLVISVIVAIAILGALLGILAGIPGIGTGEAKTAIRDLLKTIEQSGVGIETKEKVDFNVGVTLVDQLVQGTSIQTDLIKLHCAPDSTICGDDTKPVVISSTQDLDVKKKVKGTIVVGKASDKRQYHVCIGDIEILSKIKEECRTQMTSGT